MSDYCAFYANCLAGGVQGTPKPDGGWIRNKIEWTLSGHEVILLQKEEIITSPIRELTNKWIDSSMVIVKNIPQSKVKLAENITKDLAWLLSLAGLSRVCVYASEYPMGSGNLHAISTVGIAKFFRPIINIRIGPEVREFVNKCWPEFRRIKKERKLPVVFDILYYSEAPQMPIELRLVSTFIALENLKDSYARSKNIPFFRGYFRKISSPPRSNLSREPRYSFEELLSLMLREQGIRKGLKRIISLRNDIIHSGLSMKPYNSKLKTFETCHEIIRHYLLKILKYRGNYISYTNPDSIITI